MTSSWVGDVLDGRPPAPVVLVLGGFLMSPPAYRPLVRDLGARGAADIVVGNVWTMDWILAAYRGLGPILTRSGRALLEASSRSEALAGGAPVLVVGHSAGGMSARLLTSPVPFAGRRLNGASRIGAIVTLGTPHVVTRRVAGRNRVGGEAASFANREVPGPAFAPRTGYLAVASRKVVGRRQGTPGERRLFAVYDGLAPDRDLDRDLDRDRDLGHDHDRGRDQDADEIEGDGLVPLASALLPGAPQLVLDDAAHGQGFGRDWYGSPRILDHWWPVALETWRAALLARAEAAFDGSGDHG